MIFIKPIPRGSGPSGVVRITLDNGETKDYPSNNVWSYACGLMKGLELAGTECQLESE